MTRIVKFAEKTCQAVGKKWFPFYYESAYSLKLVYTKFGAFLSHFERFYPNPLDYLIYLLRNNGIKATMSSYFKI